MVNARPPLALISLILTAGAVLLLFFLVLAGSRNHIPLNQIFFLRADTSSIKGAPKLSRWTLWNVCDTDGSGHNVCGDVHPAYPFDPPRNFGTSQGVPASFNGTHKFFYLTRFAFAFILIALFFAVCSLVTGILALFSRLGGALSGLLAATALFFHSLVAALLTAAYVIGRNYFRNNHQDAHLGVKAFAFLWTALVCLLLATILFFSILATGRRETTRTPRTRGLGFRNRRANRDRGSFIETESQRRVVKDEYS
ncbi:MAG: hypothetical protein M1826_000514 [Phylliscum demangeonii]|nr:MAG: hypothetical protein M1826_000514 [Phylliscum demangeonii]